MAAPDWRMLVRGGAFSLPAKGRAELLLSSQDGLTEEAHRFSGYRWASFLSPSYVPDEHVGQSARP
jgi:hypothetical protein